MSQSARDRLTLVARLSALISLTAAIIVFFALPDKRWISAILLGEAILDTLTFAVVLPRLEERQKLG
jgi:hypothetical protein